MPPSSPAPSPKDLGVLIEDERLPAGREDLLEPLAAHSQRERLLVAIAETTAEKGYGATTIADMTGKCRPITRRSVRPFARAVRM